MSRKNNLLKYQTITQGDMSGDLTSDVTCIQWLDNIGLQFNFSGTLGGTFAVQVSLDYFQDTNGNVVNPGNWVPINLGGSATISSAVGSPIYVDINQISAPWIRAVYTNTYIESASITTVADVGGSLNDTYFLIDGADGDDWYVWFDVSAGGTDPALPGRTGVQVSITTGDTASDVATALRAALVAVTSIDTIGGSADEVTFVQSEVGVGDVTDGAVPTGFTITYTSNTGVLDAFITAKMV